MASIKNKVKNVANNKKAAGDKTKKAVTITEQGPKSIQHRKSDYGSVGELATTNYSDVINKYADDLYKSYKKLAVPLKLRIPKLSKLLKPLDKIKNILKSLTPSKLLEKIENNLLGGRSIKSLIAAGKNIFEAGKQVYNDIKSGAWVKYLDAINIGGLNVGEMVKTGRMLYDDARTMYNIVKNNDWSSLSGIVSGLDAMGGTGLGQLLKPIVDLQAVSAFVVDTFETISNSGLLAIPGFVEEFKSLFKSDNDMRNAASLAFANVAARGDIRSMTQLLGILGDGQLSNQPKTIEMILSNYRLDPLYSYAHAIKYRKELLNVLERIKRNWWKENTNHGEATILKYFKIASPDARMLLSLDVKDSVPSFKIEFMIADDYHSQNILNLIENNFRDYTFSRTKRAKE